ncbi:D-fructose 1,6-bisphosphatase [Sphaerotilus hippei]|uniref:Fructose-1,6-bisphosphatase class 1 n=1 Tax=Sphaerotilus hippei TaxID=744406 RepID=A0A318GXI0_9BURK|nr:class 1 fructose-bisphosphatase [Sphaerotilus hippei]PXW94512.1 D-fructose 1,6-bisphosphatase [Sphaerotilus hippei]
MNTTLETWLATQPTALADVLRHIAQACSEIARLCAHGALTSASGGDGGHGPAGEANVHGEVQQRLDVLADRAMALALARSPFVAGWASEEQTLPVVAPLADPAAPYLVLFDPLDGSSNIEANISVGTIFSVLPHLFRGAAPTEAAFLQPGRRQLVAGYALYGPATVLVLTVGQGVLTFTLDPVGGQWLLTRSAVQVPACTSEFAINTSNQRFWEKPVQRYVAECVAGEDGPRSRHFNMRWVASLVAEVHRILSRGGVFLYPRDHREPRRPGRLRLMYEAAPMAWLMEQAGASASTGTSELLDITPDTLHQKVPVILGSRDEVERITRYHADPSENVSWQLFKTRSLFVQAQP